MRLISQSLWMSMLVLSGLFALTASAQEKLVDFDRDVRPILSDFCFGCHGPDAATRQADLRLDQADGLFASVQGKSVVKPLQPKDSYLLHRVKSELADEQMPPPEFGRKLSAGQIDLLERWVEQGAVWQSHWAFRVPSRPQVPPLPGDFLSKSSNDSDSRHPIDRFIIQRLGGHGLHPSPRARSESLIRRLSLDLTGLPPSPTDTEAYLDDASPDADLRLIDRLLASPRLGERLANDWLDGARYADTSGYQNDGPRHMWRWRDWVIDAFNTNQPFDQFTIEQLAGDLLPQATLAQRIATGFSRNHRGNAEGGIVPAEFAVEYVVDRVETMSAVWLGLTVGCARCHDHKYDPISQREFYQLFAYFNNVPESGRAIKEGNSPPYILAPTAEQQQALDRLTVQLQSANDSWQSMQAELLAHQRAWETTAKLKNDSTSDAPAIDFEASMPSDGLIYSRDSMAPLETEPARKRAESLAPTGTPGTKGLKVQGSDGYLDFVDAGDVAKFGYFDKFSIAAWIKPAADTGTIISRMTDVAQGDGYSLSLDRGHLQLNLVKRWLDDAVRVETTSTVKLDKWTHVLATYDGTRLASSIRLYLDGVLQTKHVNLDQLNQTFATLEPLRIGGGHGPDGRFHGSINSVRIYRRALDDRDATVLACPDTIESIVAIDADKRTVAQKNKLAEYYLMRHAPQSFRLAYEQVRRLASEKQQLLESLPTVMVMEELPQRRPTFILSRGQYDQPLAEVQPNTPECLNAASEPKAKLSAQSSHLGSPPSNRLALAQWLVSPEQPLTARVTVNRYWQMLFGTGLVKTSEDFGYQGERPSHPELLDWLACDFMDSGWDVKRLLRTIVTSSTYQQSADGYAESWSKDPENRWLSRGPRFRLPAEAIRDQALSASGLLTSEIGGPSARPYQPEGLWAEIATDMDYVPSSGAQLYRRSLYTYWKRTVAPPGMQTFDAPAREACVVRRPTTNTPLQALMLMNETGIVEASRHLAMRAMREAGDDPVVRLSHAFRLVVGRKPSDVEQAVLLRSLNNFQARYTSDMASAQAALSVGATSAQTDTPNQAGTTKPVSQPIDPAQLASYTAVCNLILNLDEAITKE